MDKRKVLIVGLDGATWNLINLYTRSGKLPTFKELMNRGTYGNLESTIPSISPTAWTSAVTGVNPGKHGIFGFFDIHGYSLEYVNATYRKSKPIWTILGEKGLKVGVVNVPITYPPGKVNGFMISGVDTPSLRSELTYPSYLKNKLQKTGYVIDYGGPRDYNTERYKEKYLQSILEMIEKRKCVTLDLLKHHEWDFFIVVFVAPDRIQHFFWNYINSKNPEKDPIFSVYQEIDDALKGLLDNVREGTNTFIISDHGFGPQCKYVNTGKWLEGIGVLKRKKLLRNRLLSEIGFTRENLETVIFELNKVVDIHKIVEYLPQTIKDTLSSHTFYTTDVDWSKTVAWFIPLSGQGLRINLLGREPNGIVKPENYDGLRNWLIQKLYELRDPTTGERIVESVYKREEIFWGPYVKNAPDLLVHPKEDFLYALREDFGEMLVEPSNISGGHRLNGIFLALGPDIKKGLKIDGAKIFDIAPTILHLMDTPIFKDTDGRVLKEIFMPGSAPAKEEVKYEEAAPEGKIKEHAFSKEEEEEIKERLRRLGYLG